MDNAPTKEKTRARIILGNILFVLYVIFMVTTICISSFIWYQKNYFYHYWVNGQSMWPTLNEFTKAKGAKEPMGEIYTNMAGATEVDFVIGDGSEQSINSIKRFDIVVCDYGNGSNKEIIKRVIAMPGETFYIDSTTIGDPTNGVLHILNNETNEFEVIEQPVKAEYLCKGDYEAVGYKFDDPEHPATLKDNEYFVMGDNRSHSDDSRKNGPILRQNIESKVIALVARCGVAADSTGLELHATNIKYMWPRFY